MVLTHKDKAAWLTGVLFAVLSVVLTGPVSVLAMVVGAVLMTAGAFAGGCRISDEEHAERERNFGLPRQ